MEKAREFQKNIYFCFIDYAKAFYCVDHSKLWKITLARYSVSREVPCSVLKWETVLGSLVGPLKFPEMPGSLEWNT